MRIKEHSKKWVNRAIDITFWLLIVVVLLVVGQIFLLASFKIPSESMGPELTTGDNILVWKPTIGARLFNIYATMRYEQTEIYRVPGFRKIRRNDVLVFNFPHPNNWDKIEMHILKYYIKRCVGLPGDTLSIKNGIFQVNHIDTPIGNLDSQKRIATQKKELFGEGILNSFPFDSIIGWDIKDFGPFYIPATGDSIPMDRTHFILYKKPIEWEQKKPLTCDGEQVYLGGKKLTGYRFLKNYYFMAGDNGMDSQDSRYWGLLPEEYIVGKAWIIWKSVDPYTEKFRWDRFLKVIH